MTKLVQLCAVRRAPCADRDASPAVTVPDVGLNVIAVPGESTGTPIGFPEFATAMLAAGINVPGELAKPTAMVPAIPVGAIVKANAAWSIEYDDAYTRGDGVVGMPEYLPKPKWCPGQESNNCR